MLVDAVLKAQPGRPWFRPNCHGALGYVQEAGELLCLVKRDLPGTTSLEEEEQRSSEKLPSRPEGCVQVSSYLHLSGTGGCCACCTCIHVWCMAAVS